MAEAFICEGLRSAIGRYGGTLAAMRPDDLLGEVIRAVMASAPSLDPEAVNDVIMGCANQAGEDNRNVARMSALLAGLPETVGGATINRLCGSGLDAVAIAARTIRTGEADVILAGGVESMTRAPMVMPKANAAFSRQAEIFDTTIGWRFVNRRMKAVHGVDSMPETAENVASEFGISRTDQDAFALRSQERAARASECGRLGQEITPVSVPQRQADPIVFDADEHPRRTSLDRLAARPAPFRDGGTVTAGNASGVNDGAAALIVASEAAIERYGLTPKARVLGAATAGVPPRIMGIGPAPASKKLLDRLGIATTDLDIIELNEAFAAQVLAVTRQLGLRDDADFVNPNGGAIALGHPLGMSGARLALTAATELRNRDLSFALCTMCIGVGQGFALALEGVRQ
ncbi:MAG: 3-oxoadipyl-CoA thiolase [Boseongicola sp. SB0664_bin_43]|uniref:3-oxoadipyl-CoA thiolase n=1 Tax=Boseongicola sp. SB0664_bin_43 TaxID=2604844 RepID=A0A6B0Y3I1_9RHOB|nr:3-oxoadipyl-CoA thiolase [Boseongicola sp. SB0664_bin_43]